LTRFLLATWLYEVLWHRYPIGPYPLAYMQDGQNLFFPHEAFQHKDWQVDQTSQVLRAMRAIEDLIIIGVYSNERRGEEYTKPGYEVYARSVVEELVRGEQVFLRTTKERKDRSMWGFVVRRGGLFLYRLAIPGRIWQRRLHVEHLLL
jgi:enterochelin esterase-like enzyme